MKLRIRHTHPDILSSETQKGSRKKRSKNAARKPLYKVRSFRNKMLRYKKRYTNTSQISQKRWIYISGGIDTRFQNDLTHGGYTIHINVKDDINTEVILGFACE